MAIRLLSLLLILSAMFASIGEAKVDRSIVAKLDEPFSNLPVSRKPKVLARLQQVMGQSEPTLREVIQVPKSVFHNLLGGKRSRLASPYPRWVLHLQAALAEVSLSLGMTEEDIKQFTRYPERILFHSLKSLKNTAPFDPFLLIELEKFGIFTVYDFFRQFPKKGEFIEYIRQISPGPNFYYGNSNSLKKGYTFLKKQDQKEKKAIQELTEKYENLISPALRGALGKIGVESAHQLLNYSFAQLADQMIENEDAKLVGELLFFLSRLGMVHPRMQCSGLFIE